MDAQAPTPRVIIGAPVFNKADYLEPAVRSLLQQTFRDFSLYLIDDQSADHSVEVARRLAAEDPRVEVVVNETRLGMLGNTRRAFDLPRARHPDADFWALGSDHDLWHPAFLERLVALLDDHPDAVLSYPLAQRIDEHGRPFASSKTPRSFDTLGISDRRERLQVAFRNMSAGNMVYGLFRARALDRIGTYRAVLVPDRLMLSELALRGTFAAAPEVLWQRRFRGLAELDRQRAAFFLDKVPRYASLPWWAQHSVAVARAYGIHRAGEDVEIGRAAGMRLALSYLRLGLEHRYGRRKVRGRRVVRRMRHRFRKRLHRMHPVRVGSLVIEALLDRFGYRSGARLVSALTWLDAHRATRALATRARPRLEPIVERLAARPA